MIKIQDMKNNNIGIVWVRDDFRINKNEALSYASNNHNLVSAVYIYKKSDYEKKREAQRWWIYKSLKHYENDLKEFNIKLEFKTSDSFLSFFEKHSIYRICKKTERNIK